MPEKLRIQSSLYIFEDRYRNNKFFLDKQVDFIAWVCPKMKPTIMRPEEYVFQDDEKVKEVYFMSKGSGAYVLPPFRDTPYITINTGDSFGVVDIIGSCQTNMDQVVDVAEQPDNWFKMKHKLYR